VARTFADFSVGDRLVSKIQKISKTEIMAFARQFDPQAFHLRTKPKEESLLGGIAASGWQTAAISMRLFVDMMEVTGGMIGVAVDGLRWPRAVRPGDSLRVEIKILAARLSTRRPGYGVLRYRCITRNQEDEIVQRFLATAILPAGQAPNRSKKKERKRKRGSGR
jgi:acyl dehydratase